MTCCSRQKTHNVRPRRNIRAAMQKEVSMYAIAQKDRMGELEHYIEFAMDVNTCAL